MTHFRLHVLSFCKMLNVLVVGRMVILLLRAVLCMQTEGERERKSEKECNGMILVQWNAVFYLKLDALFTMAGINVERGEGIVVA